MHAHGREAAGGLAYARHRPEETQLYRLVEQHYPTFVEHLAEQGKAFAPRLMLPLSLTWDHRVIDGAAATRFNAYLGQILGDFRRVLL